MIDGTEENLLQTRLMTLRQQHRDLDAAISSLEASGAGDQLQLRRLKKMKLQIKDEIQKVEDKLIPDIIA
ncbi:MAG: YdcH family protein [Pseudomonadota bacterium]